MIYYAIKHKTEDRWWCDSCKFGQDCWQATTISFPLAKVNRIRAVMVNRFKEVPVTSRIENGINSTEYEIVAVDSHGQPHLAD